MSEHFAGDETSGVILPPDAIPADWKSSTVTYRDTKTGEVHSFDVAAFIIVAAPDARRPQQVLVISYAPSAGHHVSLVAAAISELRQIHGEEAMQMLEAMVTTSTIVHDAKTPEDVKTLVARRGHRAAADRFLDSLQQSPGDVPGIDVPVDHTRTAEQTFRAARAAFVNATGCEPTHCDFSLAFGRRAADENLRLRRPTPMFQAWHPTIVFACRADWDPAIERLELSYVPE